MKGLIAFIILTAGFSGILFYGKKFISAWNETFAEIRFKCKNANECEKRCGPFCRTFGECEICETDDCANCICNQHK